MATVGKSGQYWSSFSPLSIPGLALWYDFSDRSTFDLSGDYVITRVRDKSGTGRHGTPSGDAAARWIYDEVTKGVIRIPEIVIVQLILDVSLNATNNFFSGAVASSGGGPGTSYFLHPRGADPGFAFRWGSNRYSAGTNTSEVNSPFSVDPWAVSVCSFTGGTYMRTSGNGLIGGSVGGVLTPGNGRAGVELAVGSSTGGTIRSYGSMYELLVYSNVITDNDRGALENYLTNKWMQPNPAPTISAPTDISGCNLWLDVSGGASNFTFVPGTSNIVKWIDKSPMGYDVSTSGTSAYPLWQDVSEYVSFSGLPTMVSGRPEPSNGTETGFMVGIQITNSSFRGVIGASAASGPWRQIGSAGSYGIRVSNANPAVPQFNPAVLTGIHDKNPYIPTEMCWRFKGKEWLSRFAGQATNYKVTPNWADISGTGRTVFGPANHLFKEVILYDRALSANEISNVSAYLTRKWNLSNVKTFENPPSSNRAFASTPPFTRPYQIPYDIANCVLWLDAKDRNTLVLDASSNVLTWYDKSGWQNDVSAGSSRPAYSNETLVFNSNSMSVRNPTTGSGNNFRFDPTFLARYHTLIALHKPLVTDASNTGNTGLIDFSYGYGSTNTRNISFPTMDGTTPRGYVSSMTTGATRTTSTFLENSVTTEYNIITASVQVNNFTIYRNGVVQRDVSSITAANDSFTGSTSLTSIGRWGARNSNFYQGEVKEIMIFDRAISPFAVAQVEYYLAKKWDLTSLLPSNHLGFSNAFPMTTTVSPPAVHEIAMWVDAMTYASEYSNNATITTNWSNRATFPSTVVPVGTPKFLSNAWQGRPAIDMASGAFVTTFRNDASLSGLYHQTFMVVSYNTGTLATNQTPLFFRASPTTNPKHTVMQIRAVDASMISVVTTAAGTVAGTASTGRSPAPAGSPFIFECGQNAIFNMGWSANGSTISNGASFSTLGATSYGWAGIGCDSSSNTTPTWNGNIHEIIAFGVAPGDFDNQSRFQMRSYLARKWGILGSMPTYPDKGMIV
jgi:hypothetical protein